MKRLVVIICLFGLIQPSETQVKNVKPDSQKVKQARSYLDILQVEKESEIDSVIDLIGKLKVTKNNIRTIKVYLKDTSTFEAASVIAPDTVKK